MEVEGEYVADVPMTVRYDDFSSGLLGLAYERYAAWNVHVQGNGVWHGQWSHAIANSYADGDPVKWGAFQMLLGLSFLCQVGDAQNIATAKGPGSYTAVGGEVSVFQADYGQRILGGGLLFADVNPTWRYGIEAEARYLHFHTFEGVTETNYFVGPRVMLKPGPIRPYVKFLVGAGRITLPLGYAQGTFFTYAPGGGVDYIVGDRLTVRIVDFEYQMWPGFSSYGELRPYGISSGISLRLNPVDHYPKNGDRWRWR
jgi:hypothetical protein